MSERFFSHISIRLIAAAIVLLSLFTTPAAAQTVNDQWSWTTQQPAEGWQERGFDESQWQRGQGGFGTRDTPGACVATEWNTDRIWLRKQITLTEVTAQPALLIHHDEDAVVYLNGQQIASFPGFLSSYQTVPLSAAAAALLTAGKHVLAVHCRQTNGGQFIDVHLIDATNPPRLPRTSSLVPFDTALTTTWGESVTAENAWTEYPRQRLVRDHWTCLNGHWELQFTPFQQLTAPQKWEQKILVPFAPESRLSGVRRMLDASEALWYRRTIIVSPVAETRTLLHFEAVDYECEVRVNGRIAGTHIGGHTPFSVDITDLVSAGENELIVRVVDATEEFQLRGKQVINPNGIWYTQVSGIWQTVWMETVPLQYLQDVVDTTSAERGTISVSPVGTNRLPIAVDVHDGETCVAAAEGEGTVILTIPDAKLWSPDSPHLYDLKIRLLSEEGSTLDTVRSYAGIRSVGRIRDAHGHWRMTLNGKPIFHWGPLDQGWWPDGLLPPHPMQRCCLISNGSGRRDST